MMAPSQWGTAGGCGLIGTSFCWQRREVCDMTLATNVKTDLQIVRTCLKELALLDRLRDLERPQPAYAFAFIALSWAIIFASWLLVVHCSLHLLPLALLLFATGQRFLGNNLHDASHGNLSRRGNATLGRLLLAPPMFEDFRRYTKLHMEHHQFLGDGKLDPDFLPVPPGCGESALKVYLKVLATPKRWRASVVADLLELTLRQKMTIALWWLALVAILALAAGPVAALWFGVLWMTARATTYHALKTFTELADHGGLPAGGILSSTRNSPCNLLSLFLHPRYDNFHLTHHLAPGVPMANLLKAHAILLSAPPYRDGHQCDSYFLGPRSVVHSWVAAQSGFKTLGEVPLSPGTSKRNSALVPRS